MGYLISRDLVFFRHQPSPRPPRKAERQWQCGDTVPSLVHKKIFTGCARYAIDLGTTEYPSNYYAADLTRRKKSTQNSLLKFAIVCLDLNPIFFIDTAAELKLAGSRSTAASISAWLGSLRCVGRCEMIRKPAQLHIGTRLSQQPQIRYAPPGQPHAMLPNTHSHVCSRAPFRPWPLYHQTGFFWLDLSIPRFCPYSLLRSF
jgi:hypothetical protein